MWEIKRGGRGKVVVRWLWRVVLCEGEVVEG